jgi:hypothetical protein
MQYQGEGFTRAVADQYFSLPHHFSQTGTESFTKQYYTLGNCRLHLITLPHFPYSALIARFPQLSSAKARLQEMITQPQQTTSNTAST